MDLIYFWARMCFFQSPFIYLLLFFDFEPHLSLLFFLGCLINFFSVVLCVYCIVCFDFECSNYHDWCASDMLKRLPITPTSRFDIWTHSTHLSGEGREDKFSCRMYCICSTSVHWHFNRNRKTLLMLVASRV